MLRLKNKTAIVTGGGSGIGRAISELFAKNGATVHILEVNIAAAEEVVKGILGQGGKAMTYECDISNQSEVKKVLAPIFDNDKIDILVNNAGIAHVGNLEQTEEQDMDRLYAVNIKGVYNMMRSTIGHFKQNKGGVILNMASIASTVAVADRFAYSMTKGAVLTMTYSVAKDYIAENIRCNCISPARIHTPFVDTFIKENYPGNEKAVFDQLSKTQPIGRMGEPEEVAQLALYLCSDEAKFITGTDFPIDGGFIKLNG